MCYSCLYSTRTELQERILHINMGFVFSILRFECIFFVSGTIPLNWKRMDGQPFFLLCGLGKWTAKQCILVYAFSYFVHT
jgi:hypothetical protein